MSARITSALVLAALVSLSIAAWPIQSALAQQQPRPGAQKAPAAPKGGGPQQAGGGEAEGGGRSPAQPHIAKARQLINQAQDFDGAMKELDIALQLDPQNPFVH